MMMRDYDDQFDEDVDPKEVSELLVFHDKLNPKFFDEDDRMISSVRLNLLQNASEFYDFLEIPDLKVKDIIVVGSNASYNYTRYSDMDVHLLVDLAKTSCPDIMENLFHTKKSLWNERRNVKIKGQDIEMYVQDTASLLKSRGVYSLVSNKWLAKPSKSKPSIDDSAVITKTDGCVDYIDSIIEDRPSLDKVEAAIKKIHTMRRSGLDSGGEFSVENLTYKMLRNLGYIDKLYDLKAKIIDRKLSQF